MAQPDLPLLGTPAQGCGFPMENRDSCSLQAALMLLLPWGIPSPTHAKFPPWLGLWVLGGQAREGQASWFCPLQGLVELNTEVGMGVRIGGS